MEIGRVLAVFFKADLESSCIHEIQSHMQCLTLHVAKCLNILEWSNYSKVFDILLQPLYVSKLYWEDILINTAQSEHLIWIWQIYDVSALNTLDL